jgi:hypothetical protein
VPRPIVMIIGDSNIAFVLSALALDLTGKTDPFVLVDAAQHGATLRAMAWDVLLPEALGRLDVDGFVINLGVNDTAICGTATGKGYADYDEKIDWLLGLVPAAPTWWTTLPCDLLPANRHIGASVVNEALSAAPTRWKNLTVLDFAATARGHHNYLLTTFGGVHLAPPGAVAWARLVSSALHAHFFPR